MQKTHHAFPHDVFSKKYNKRGGQNASMQEKDSNPRPPAYEAGELATALSCNMTRSPEELPGACPYWERILSMHIINVSII